MDKIYINIFIYVQWFIKVIMIKYLFNIVYENNIKKLKYELYIKYIIY